MKMIAIAPYFKVDKKGNYKRMPAGTIITHEEWVSMAPAKQLKFEPKITKYTRYTTDEIIEIVSLYLINDNPDSVADRFLQLNPTTTHTRDSVKSLAFQLRAMDICYPEYTQWIVKSNVEVVALTIDPDRFLPMVELQKSA